MTRRTVGAILGAVALSVGSAVLGATLAPDAAPAPVAPSAPAAPSWVPAGTPRCVTEDAAGPCYFDAASRGNGTGRSFVVGADGAVRVVSAPVPAPGSVLTSDGRTAELDADTGCVWLTYGEAYGDPGAGDPGDGEKFCPQ